MVYLRSGSEFRFVDGESGFGWILMVLIAGDRDAIGKAGFGFLITSLFLSYCIVETFVFVGSP